MKMNKLYNFAPILLLLIFGHHHRREVSLVYRTMYLHIVDIGNKKVRR